MRIDLFLFLCCFRGERETTLSAECKHHDPSYVTDISGSDGTLSISYRAIGRGVRPGIGYRYPR